MKTLSIHNIDDKTLAFLREKAKVNGMSLNKTIQLLLKKALGLKKESSYDHAEEFSDLFGVWKKADAQEFDRTARTFETIDKEDWQ